MSGESKTLQGSMPGKMHRTLVACWTSINGEDTGYKVRVANIARHLSGETFILQPGERHPSFHGCVLRDTSGTIAGMHAQILGYCRPCNIIRALRCVNRVRPTRIVIEGIYAAWPFLLLKPFSAARLVFDTHNVEYEQVMQRFPRLAPLAWLVWLAEGLVCACSDRIVVCSEREAALLRRLYGVGVARKTVVLPNCSSVTPSQLSRAQARRSLGIPAKANVAMFVGKLDYAPNRGAVEWILAAANRMPRLLFVIVGAPAKPGRKGNVLFTGRVADLADALAAADVCIAPITAGSGTRLKILDYLAAGLPVLTTPKGCEGIDVRDGEHCVIRELGRFDAELGPLCDDRRAQATLGSAGMALVRGRYAWRAIVGRAEAQGWLA